MSTSPALGQGWRVGFLGLLHLEVFNQRLEQEYGTAALITAPSVPYKGTHDKLNSNEKWSYTTADYLSRH